jgi:hypothetical protein
MNAPLLTILTLAEAQATLIVTAIAKGAVPHMRMEY